MFDSLVDLLKTNIDELNGHEVKISSEFKEHHNEDSEYIFLILPKLEQYFSRYFPS